MTTLLVDSLQFKFADNIAAGIYDQWKHYQEWSKKHQGQKAVDVVAVESAANRQTLWLVEAKDFRVITNPPKQSNIVGLAQTVAAKASHTLAGLADAAAKAILSREKTHAAAAISATATRVVLHLEPHTGRHSALFLSGFTAGVLQQLRQLARNLGPNPLVLRIANTPSAGVPWTVT